MDDHKRDDAADRAPRPDQNPSKIPSDETVQQDGPNYSGKTDGGRALKPEEVNSANDE